MTLIDIVLFLLFILAIVILSLAFEWAVEKISKWFDEH